MKTKRIDFDIDLAKKIQAGEAQGRIVTREGLPARVICWDRIDEDYPIVALVRLSECELENCSMHTTSGYLNDEKYHTSYDLFLEVPDDTPNFKPYDRVLARRIKSDEWSCTFYSHFEGEHHNCMGILFKHCIPYEGNEHLVGTTGEPKEGGEQ